MKFIILGVILTSTYILLGGLMKAAGKATPSISAFNYKEDKNN